MPAKKISTTLFFGLIAAGVMAVVVTGTWLAGPEAFVGWQVWMGKSLVILLAAFAAMSEKRAHGGIIDFRSALRVTFGVLVMGIVAADFVAWLIVNVINPDFYRRLLPVILRNAAEIGQRAGWAADQTREQLDYIRAHSPFSLGSMVIGLGRDLLLFGILAILIAVTVKSKKAPAPRP